MRHSTAKSLFNPQLHTRCFVFHLCFVFSEAKPLGIARGPMESQSLFVSEVFN